MIDATTNIDESNLKRLSFIEGVHTSMPEVLIKALRRHIEGGGQEEEFCHPLWTATDTLGFCGRRPARFQSSGGHPMSATRFAYGDKHQIVVVECGGYRSERKSYSVIVNPVKNYKPLAKVTQKGWQNMPWQIWREPSLPIGHMISNMIADPTFRVVRTIRDQPYPPPGSCNVSGLGHGSASRTIESSEPPSGPSVDRNRKRGFCQGLLSEPEQQLPHVKQPRLTDSHRLYPTMEATSYTQEPVRRGESEESKENIPNGTMDANLYALRKTKIDDKVARYLLSQNSTTSDTVSLHGGDEQTRTVSPDVKTEVTASTSNDVQGQAVEFLFLDQDNIVQRTSKLADCSTATDLFDEAYMAGIVDGQTRMLHININNAEIRLKVNKEDAFQEMVMNPLMTLMRVQDESVGTIQVSVSKGY